MTKRKYKRHTIEDLKHFASKNHNGKCLSKDYTRNDRKYLWKCQDKSHDPFDAGWDNVKRGGWCKACSHKNQTIDFNDIQSKIKSLGGKIITKKHEYKNSKTPINYFCENGHPCSSDWDRLRYAKIKENGKKVGWCSTCSKRKKYTIEQIRDIAKEKGGELSSTFYNDNKETLNWICANGHAFSNNLHNVLQGQWCKECNSSIGENLTRFYLEYILQVKFTKSYPQWLKMNTTPLELDGYNAKSKVAFEYQGVQHKRYVQHFHRNGKMDFEQQRIRDNYKREKCKQKQINLIEIDDETTSREDLYTVLYAKCVDLGLNVKKKNKPDINIFYSKFYQNELIPILNIVNDKNGEFLSHSYKGKYKKLEFKCQNEHVFNKTPAQILKGIWCTELGCYDKARDPNKVNAYIEEKGGVLLSEYVNNHSPIKFQCENGHINTTTWQSLRVSWCCKCAVNCKGTIEEMQEIARLKGGLCLSKEYLGSEVKLEWSCNNKNHPSWRATPGNVKPTKSKKGSWCPECDNLRKRKGTNNT